jgi:hypothetical protein
VAAEKKWELDCSREHKQSFAAASSANSEGVSIVAGISRRIVMTSNPTDYVYVHVHPQRTDEVVYVGRGSDGRAWSSARRSKAHLVWIREWQARGYSPDQYVRIVSRGLTPQQAVKLEERLLAFHWEKGDQLFNKQSYKGRTRQHQNRFYADGPRRDTKGTWKE